MKKKVNVGVVGCGGICKTTYMENMVNRFSVINVVGCYDLITKRMNYMANRYHLKTYKSLEEICSDPEIDVICNLTNPESHVLVSKTAMEHGKHVYCEKMMAPTFEEATMLMELAEQKGVHFTTAPDTFLGAWEQSARTYLDLGAIGKPVTVHAQCTTRYEPESPFFDTERRFFFFPLHYGGGYPFDIGGYYLHEMINLFGTVKSVMGYGGNINPHRTFINPHHPKYQEPFEVNTPTTVLAALEFECGVLGTIHFSSDSFSSQSFVVTGTQGTLQLGDPNACGSDIYLTRRGLEAPAMGAAPSVPGVKPISEPMTFVSDPSDDDAQSLMESNTFTQRAKLPLFHAFSDHSTRGMGLADMCYAILNGRRPRCHADIGYHAIEIIHGVLTSAQTGQRYEMTSRCERPEPLPFTSLSPTAQESSLDN